MNEKTTIKNRKRSKKYYWNNRDNVLQKMKKYQQTPNGIKSKKQSDHKYIRTDKAKRNKQLYRLHLKIIALQIYSDGAMMCSNCGHDDIDCLDLDHLKNDGCILRKELGYHRSIYEWVKSKNYPQDFQVLCRNCNWKKYLESKGDRYL